MEFCSSTMPCPSHPSLFKVRVSSSAGVRPFELASVAFPPPPDSSLRLVQQPVLHRFAGVNTSSILQALILAAPQEADGEDIDAGCQES